MIKMSNEKVISSSNLEPFLLLMKGARCAGAVSVLTQALDAPNVHVFGELLDLPAVQELANGPHAQFFDLLNVFAYGTCREYNLNKHNLPSLSPVQLKKLRHLTIVSLAAKNKCIPYSVLLEELGVLNVRSLEDLIIEGIYMDIIHGKLDQENQQLEVEYTIGRDIRPSSVAQMVSLLAEWCSGCETMLSSIETQIEKANCNHEAQVRSTAQIEQEVAAVKRNLKADLNHDHREQSMTVDCLLDSNSDLSKSASRGKGLQSDRCQATQVCGMAVRSVSGVLPSPVRVYFEWSTLQNLILLLLMPADVSRDEIAS